ncbi:MAG TPA: hypothetical protein VH087_07615 [Thermoanaerobaculia bacterium]|nr:hypothetical protein [Thermoanaerobaculia bacterium]
MQNRPGWYTDETESGWSRVSAAFRNDWEQTKHDFGSKTAPDLKQDVDDTVKQATGAEDPFARHEQAFRFGYGAQRQYRSQYPTWNNDLDKQLRSDYGSDYDSDRDYIRYAYDYRYGNASSNASDTRDDRRP